MIRFIVGVILGHILCLSSILLVDEMCKSEVVIAAALLTGVGLIVGCGYLFYVFKQKQMSSKWIIINKWLAPILITFAVLQWCPCILLISKLIFIEELLLLMALGYYYRVSLFFELPIIGYVYYKVNEHLSSLSSEE